MKITLTILYTFLLVSGITLNFDASGLQAQTQIKNADGSITYIFYRELEFFRAVKGDVGEYPQVCAPNSDIVMRPDASIGKVTVEVKTNFNVIDNKKIKENYTLLKFDSENKDYTTPANVSGLTDALDKLTGEVPAQQTPAQILEKLYIQATLDAQIHYRFEDKNKIVWGIPVAIYVTLPAGGTGVQGGRRVPIQEFEYAKLLYYIQIPHMLSMIFSDDLLAGMPIKYTGLKRIKVMQILVDGKVVQSLEAEKKKAASSAKKAYYTDLISNYEGSSDKFGFPASGIMRAYNGFWRAEENRRLLNGEFLVPFPVADASLSLPMVFTAIFTNDRPLYVLAMNKEVVLHNLTTVSEGMKYKVSLVTGGTTENVAFYNEKGTPYYMYKVTWDFGEHADPNLIPKKISGTVTNAGPFPYAQNFAPGPHTSAVSKVKPIFKGPSPAKPAIICAHRGTFRTHDYVPENSPWAWEKAIYDSWHNIDGTPRYLQARRRNGDPKVDAQGNPVWEQAVMVGGKTLRFDKDGNPVYKHDTYLDMIELDIQSVDRDGVLLVTHDNNPYRELDIQFQGKPILNLWDSNKNQIKFSDLSYENATKVNASWPDPINGTKSAITEMTIGALSNIPMKDFFGNKVEFSHMLTFKEALEYFKCRQRYGACKCLAETGYLGPMGMQLLQRKAEYAEDFEAVFAGSLEDKKWVMQNDQPFTVLLTLDKVMAKDFDQSRLLPAFQASLETSMEDFMVYKGTFHAYSSRSQNLPVYTTEKNLKHDVRAQVFCQIRYTPDFLWNDSPKKAEQGCQRYERFYCEK